MRKEEEAELEAVQFESQLGGAWRFKRTPATNNPMDVERTV